MSDNWFWKENVGNGTRKVTFNKNPNFDIEQMKKDCKDKGGKFKETENELICEINVD